jgi:hypothetical protein
LPEVKEAMITGRDTAGVSSAIAFYYNKINSQVKQTYKSVADEEHNMMSDEIENYICKRLYKL